VVAEELSLAAGPELVAERLLDALKHPFKLGAEGEIRVTVTASVGVAAGEPTSRCTAPSGTAGTAMPSSRPG
jgi:hypothetical protein